ncbi:MAG: lamin tail domain-containing protein [Saprospiraceae bacterium]|nr:lamin tail domain-containing protein [Saprospiraceae bacterium]
MKKLILSFCCFLCLALTSQAQIVITEIMYNPPESNVDSLEYIELYNNSNASVNLENWSMVGVTMVFPAITLGPNEYVLTAVNAAAMQNQFGKTAYQWAGALSNGGELLAVLNPAGDTIDKVAYSNMAPWPIAAVGNGSSLVLCDPNSDNTQAANWQAATTPTGVTINGKAVLANPGAAASCPSGVTALDDQYITASGTAASFQVLQNDLLPGQSTATLNIQTGPQHGTATVGANNTILYTPAAGYCGTDQFTYQVCENTDCDEGTVSIIVRCYPKYTIDQINNLNSEGVADSLGKYCELSATVYGVNLRGATGLQFTMIDGSNNGITVFSALNTYGYSVKEKDKITVRGSINQFNGLIQIFPDTLIKESANNPLVTPLDVTVHTENTESKLIRIKNLHYVDAAQWATGIGTGFSVFMVSDDSPLDTIQVRIDNDVELFNQPAPPTPFDLTGIGGQFDPATPYDAGYQIAPRYANDVSTLVSTRQVDFSANVQLTPNPASDMLRIQTNLPFNNIQVLSATGQVLYQVNQPGNEEIVPLQTMPAGLYFVRFTKNGGSWMTRFVKL